MTMESLFELSRQFHDLLHDPRVWQQAVQDTDAIAQITAARDVIEDTDWAITAHQTMAPRTDRGELYLVVYGVLQALDAQAEASQALVRAFARATGANFRFSQSAKKQLDDLLLARHRAIGHSVKGERKRECIYYGITHNSLEHNSFKLHHWESMLGEKRHSPTRPLPQLVEIPELIRDIQSLLREELTRLLDVVKHRMQSLGAETSG